MERRVTRNSAPPSPSQFPTDFPPPKPISMLIPNPSHRTSLTPVPTTSSPQVHSLIPSPTQSPTSAPALVPSLSTNPNAIPKSLIRHPTPGQPPFSNCNPILLSQTPSSSVSLFLDQTFNHNLLPTPPTPNHHGLMPNSSQSQHETQFYRRLPANFTSHHTLGANSNSKLSNPLFLILITLQFQKPLPTLAPQPLLTPSDPVYPKREACLAPDS